MSNAELDGATLNQLAGAQRVAGCVIDLPKERYGRFDVRHGDQCRLAAARFGEELQDRRRDNPQGSFGSQKQLLQIVAGVVLPQAAQAVPDPPVGQDNFQAKHQIPRVAVAQHVDPPGIGGQIAADATASLGGEAQRKQGADGVGGRLNVGQDCAGFHGHRPVGGIDGADPVETLRAQDEAAAWHATAHHAGIPALGNQGHASLGAQANDLGNFLCAGRPDDRRTATDEQPARFVQISGKVVGLVDAATLTNDRADPIQQAGRHARVDDRS